MNRLVRLFDVLVFGNVFIACCAAAMFSTTRLLNGFSLALSPALLLVAGSTLFYYNFHHHSHHLDYSSGENFKKSVRQRLSDKTEMGLLLLGFLLTVAGMLCVSLPVLLAFLLLSLFSFAYSVPLVKWDGKRRKLRDSLFFKLPFLALSWSAMTVLLPLLELQQDLHSGAILGQAIARAIFVYGLCIPFEIRDMEGEKKWGATTLPVVYGLRITKMTGIIMTGIGFLLRHLGRSEMAFSTPVLLALDVTAFFVLFWIITAKTHPSKYFCKIFVDGTMLLQFLFVYLSTSIS